MTEPADEDDVTIWAGRLRAWPGSSPDPEPDAGFDDATALVARDPEPPLRRRTAPPAEHPDPPEPDETALRRRPHPAPPERATPVAPSPEGRRTARIPEPESREIYRPRLPQPEIVERRAPAPRAPQHPVGRDATAVGAAQRMRRRRRRWVTIVVCVAALAALAAAGGMLLLALG